MANVQDPDTSDLTNFRLTASSHIGPKQLALFVLEAHAEKASTSFNGLRELMT